MRWGAVCRDGPCGHISSVHPCDDWLPLDFHGFFKWVFDSLEVLNGFLGQVVSFVGMMGFASGLGGSGRRIRVLGGMLGFGLILFLLFLSRILVGPHLVDAEFHKAWMPFFCRYGHPVTSPDQFLDFVGHLLPQEPYLDFPRITGRDLQEVARAKKSTAGGMDGWLGLNQVKALPLPWFSGLAVLLELVESTGIWPQGLLDTYIAMIPKEDVDSTPLGQRPPSVPLVVYRLWASFRL